MANVTVEKVYMRMTITGWTMSTALPSGGGKDQLTALSGETNESETK